MYVDPCYSAEKEGMINGHMNLININIVSLEGVKVYVNEDSNSGHYMGTYLTYEDGEPVKDGVKVVMKKVEQESKDETKTESKSESTASHIAAGLAALAGAEEFIKEKTLVQIK